jgi:hypothetical protein
MRRLSDPLPGYLAPQIGLACCPQVSWENPIQSFSSGNLPLQKQTMAILFLWYSSINTVFHPDLMQLQPRGLPASLLFIPACEARVRQENHAWYQ